MEDFSYLICCSTELCEFLIFRSLQKTLDELQDYQEKHEIFQVEQARLQSEQAPADQKLDQRLGYEQQRIRESSTGTGENCRMMRRDGKQIFNCTWGRRNIFHPVFDIVRVIGEKSI